LRVLVHEVSGPAGVTKVANMAGLSPAGARKGLETLERLGVTDRIGSGRSRQFGLRPDNAYLAVLRRLFELEEKQYEDLIQELRRAVAMPEVREAWVRGLADGSSPALELDVVAETRALSWIGQELRTRLLETEKRFDLIVEVNVFTDADNLDVPDDAIVLWGYADRPPDTRSPGVLTHAESAERSLRVARVVAELIRSDPSLIRRALQHADRLLREGQGTSNAEIAEWKQLLETYSPERVRDLLVSESSRAQRLRRSSPFLAVLTPDEQDRVIREIESKR